MTPPTSEETKKVISEITQRYREGKTMSSFARALGIHSSRQAVFQWLNGISCPDTDTLFRVLASPEAAPWAKTWAGECLTALQNSTPALIAHETDLTKAIERAR
jgi:hypothetical protein